jgi:hypothetical protein
MNGHRESGEIDEMRRARDDDLPQALHSTGFTHRRRPLDPGEPLPPKTDLIGQIRALSNDAKRLSAHKAASEPVEGTELESEDERDDDL